MFIYLYFFVRYDFDCQSASDFYVTPAPVYLKIIPTGNIFLEDNGNLPLNTPYDLQVAHSGGNQGITNLRNYPFF